MSTERTTTIPLSTWYLEKRGRWWHIVRPGFFTVTPRLEKGPYSTLMSACLMIARELVREVLARR